MCGIAGILFKQQEGPTGEILIKMLADLNRRGPDSTGLALYSNLPKGNLVLRLKVDEDARHESVDWEACLVETAQEYGSVRESRRVGQYVRLVMDYEGSYEELTAAIEASGEGVEVLCMGQHLEIIKQMGGAGGVDATTASPLCAARTPFLTRAWRPRAALISAIPILSGRVHSPISPLYIMAISPTITSCAAAWK
ncbi:MAG TPA: hypothetical protein VKR83_12820 [Ktedonobacteraceae bacterium]|nr:hypothetical protein [Ktedonobacteraceae bacterium]